MIALALILAVSTADTGCSAPDDEATVWVSSADATDRTSPHFRPAPRFLGAHARCTAEYEVNAAGETANVCAYCATVADYYWISALSDAARRYAKIDIETSIARAVSQWRFDPSEDEALRCGSTEIRYVLDGQEDRPLPDLPEGLSCAMMHAEDHDEA
jgi:hypothetical protein